MKHIPALDGVRGFAVLMVLLFHTAHLSRISVLDEVIWRITRGLDSGVDLFFVLSGFLITGILLDAKDSPSYFRNFYARRTLRILPLCYAVVACCFLLPLAIPAVQHFDFPRLQHGGLNYWLYVSNVWKTGPHPVLGVAWSLSIEEQFYLIWPLLVYVLSRRQLTRLCVLNIAVSLLYRVCVEYTTIRLPAHAPIARLDVLSIGAMIALASRRDLAWCNLKRIRNAASAAFLIEILLIAYERGPWGRLKWSIGVTVMGVIYGWMIAEICMGAQGAVARFFSNAALTTFGKYSYAIYFIHSPLDAVLRRTVLPVHRLVPIGGSQLLMQLVYWFLVATMSLVAAWISWHSFEKHFLKLKSRFAVTPHGAAALPAPPRSPKIVSVLAEAGETVG